MCDPVTLTALAVASTVAATAGTLYAGKAAANQAEYQGKVDDRNAHLADVQAQDAQQRGAKDAQSYYRRLSAVKGQQQAAMAANGLDANFGSALQVQEDTAMIGAEDAGTIFKNTNKETQGFEINALNYRSAGNASRASASAALVGSYIGAAGSALGGATQAGRFARGD